jgi:hypothetical protein
VPRPWTVGLVRIQETWRETLRQSNMAFQAMIARPEPFPGDSNLGGIMLRKTLIVAFVVVATLVAVLNPASVQAAGCFKMAVGICNDCQDVCCASEDVVMDFDACTVQCVKPCLNPWVYCRGAGLCGL